MPDIFTKKKRSEVMSLIRSRGNQRTEVTLAKLFRRWKIAGWRRHLKICVQDRGPLPAGRSFTKNDAHGIVRPRFHVRPDFVFRKHKLAIFVDGCFWHRCPKHETQPKSNRDFWRRKFAINLKRDRLVNRALHQANWRVLRIWEHELTRKNESRLLKRIIRAL